MNVFSTFNFPVPQNRREYLQVDYQITKHCPQITLRCKCLMKSFLQLLLNFLTSHKCNKDPMVPNHLWTGNSCVIILRHWKLTLHFKWQEESIKFYNVRQILIQFEFLRQLLATKRSLFRCVLWNRFHHS